MCLQVDGGYKMRKEKLEKIIFQIKHYELLEQFADIGQFKDWLSKLTGIQIDNFIGLNIDLKEVKDIKKLLINHDLLSCTDYIKRVEAISKLKNGTECLHLLDVLCKPNFLSSKNFYQDLEKVSKAKTARYALWILGESHFIHSPYHDEDLELIIKSNIKSDGSDFLIAESLAIVAKNLDSIQSPFHQADMKLISSIGRDTLQETASFPAHSLNNLAINKVSLSDRYHLENMLILAKNPIANEFLYAIMTNEKIIKGKYYREEINALLEAKSKLTANVLYEYIIKSDNKENIDYMNRLNTINLLDDQIAMYYVTLLLNENFMSSTYSDFDLKLLQSISNKDIFLDLYQLIIDESFANSSYHKLDAVMISKANDKSIRSLLRKEACLEESIKSSNHEYDMQFIFDLKLESLDEKIRKEIYYYLFQKGGINDSKHKEKLEQLLQGVLVERSTDLSAYLNYLLEQKDEVESNCPNETMSDASSKTKPKILSLFKKRKKR